MKNRLLEPLLLIGLTPFYYLSPWKDLVGAGPGWGVAFLFFYLLYLPGRIIHRNYLPVRLDVLASAAASTLLGLAYFLFVAFVWALTGSDLSVLGAALPVTFAPLIALLFLKRRATHDDSVTPPSSIASLIVVVLVSTLVFVLVAGAGIPIDYLKDTLDHVAYIAEIRDTGEAFPTSAFYADAGDNGQDIRKGLLHVLYGFSSQYLGAEPLAVLDAWNAFFALLILLSVYGAAVLLFGHPWVAALSMIFYLVGMNGGLEGIATRVSFYGHNLGMGFFLFFIGFAVRYVTTRDRLALVSGGVFAFAAACVHGLFIVLPGLAVAVIGLWNVSLSGTPAKEHWKRVITVGLAVLLGTVPYVLYRFVTAYQTPNELHSEVQGVAYIGKLFIADPSKVLHWYGPIGWVSFFLVFLVRRASGHNAGLGYAVAAGFTIPLVLLNPFVFPAMHSALTYLMLRLPKLFPFYMLAAYFLVRFLEGTRVDFKRTPAVWIGFAALMLAVVVELKPAFGTHIFSLRRIENEHRNSYLRWNDGLAMLRDKLPPGSVIATDPLTAYSITAFTPHYTTCTLDQHAPPADQLLASRIRGSRQVLSPFTTMGETTDALQSMGAEYIVINNRIGHRPVLLHYWAMDPALFETVRHKFSSQPQRFEIVADLENFVVFRWNGTRGPVAGEDNHYYLSHVPEGFTSVGEISGEATIEAVHIERDTVRRGEMFDITCVWSVDRDLDLGSYVVALRFDHTSVELPFGGKPFPKLARKVKERLSGEFYRFRADHRILGGLLSPDVWPVGKLVLDRSTVQIPAGMAPGEYTVSAKLLGLPPKPNYRVRDFLYDDDIYQGVPVGRVVLQ